MFENKLTHNGIHYSRYIASWINADGDLHFNQYRSRFANWLRATQALTDKEVQEICELAENGKLELEISARNFIKNVNERPVQEKPVEQKTTIYKTYDQKVCREAEKNIGDLGSAFDDLFKEFFPGVDLK